MAASRREVAALRTPGGPPSPSGGPPSHLGGGPSARQKPAASALERARSVVHQACEIFLKIGGDPPIDETTCKRVARDTATPYVFELETADIGKTAYWLFRWVNGKDEPGPFGPLVSATITA